VNAGRLAVAFIVLSAVLGGVALWYTAERAFYEPVAFQPGAEIRLVPLATDQPEPIVVAGIEGTDAASSPYPGAVPLNAPASFPCFDAAAIGRALETGEALAFLSEPGIHSGVDRVVAVFGDGRAYAWHQLSPRQEDAAD
jgi:hypothetical protein